MPLDSGQAQEATFCACFNLRKAARAVTQLFDDQLRPTGLRATQFTLLMNIQAHEPLQVQELAEVTVTDRTTLSRNLRPLQRDGLVTLTPRPEDRRVREVALTEKGRQTLNEAYPLWREIQGKLVGQIGTDQFSELLTSLQQAVQEAHRVAEPRAQPA